MEASLNTSIPPPSAINSAVSKRVGSLVNPYLQPPLSVENHALDDPADFFGYEAVDEEEPIVCTPLEEGSETAANHLFLWSIFSAQAEASKELWQHTTEPIAAALLACRLLRRLAELLAKDQTYDDEREDLTNMAE